MNERENIEFSMFPNDATAEEIEEYIESKIPD